MFGSNSGISVKISRSKNKYSTSYRLKRDALFALAK